MQEFREMVRGWLGKSLLALLAIPFVFVGIESYFGGSSDPVVAEVDGNEINQSLLDRAVDNQRQQLLARMGPDAVLSASEQAVQQFVELLQDAGALRHHRVLESARRRSWLIMQHFSATIEQNDGGGRWAVDTWFRDHAEPAVVMDIEEWKDGGYPDE